MRKAGGVLTIIGGITGIVLGRSGVEAFVTGGEIVGIVIDIGGVEAPFIAFIIVALIVGIVALIGGIYALRARVWGLALAGGIVLIPIGAVLIGGDGAQFVFLAFWGFPFLTLGTLGTIFIALRKGEFA